MGAGILNGGPTPTDPKGLILNLPNFAFVRSAPIAGLTRKYGA